MRAIRCLGIRPEKVVVPWVSGCIKILQVELCRCSVDRCAGRSEREQLLRLVRVTGAHAWVCAGRQRGSKH